MSKESNERRDPKLSSRRHGYGNRGPHTAAVAHRNRRRGPDARRRRAQLRLKCVHVTDVESSISCGVPYAKHGATHQLGHEHVQPRQVPSTQPNSNETLVAA
jgi:hypothetical protein